MTEQARLRRGMVLAGIMGSVFLAAMESTVVATAMPTVIATLGGIQIYSWAFSGYLLASTVTIDRKSTRLNSSHIQKSRMPSSA